MSTVTGSTGSISIGANAAGFIATTGYTGGEGTNAIAIGASAGYESDVLFSLQNSPQTAFPTSAFLVSTASTSTILLPQYNTTTYYLSTSAVGSLQTFIATVTGLSNPFTTVYSNTAGTTYFALSTTTPFYSTNSGASWTAVSGAPSALACSAGVSPSFGTIMYATGSLAGVAGQTTNVTGSVYIAQTTTSWAFTQLTTANNLPATIGYYGACAVSGTGASTIGLLSYTVPSISSTLYFSSNMSNTTPTFTTFSVVLGSSVWTSTAINTAGNTIIAGTSGGHVYIGSSSTLTASTLLTLSFQTGASVSSVAISPTGQLMAVVTATTIFVSYNAGISFSTVVNTNAITSATTFLAATLTSTQLLITQTGSVPFLYYTLVSSVATVAIGANSGNINQGTNTLAVGFTSGAIAQGANAIAVGALSGNTNQSANTISIGYQTSMENDIISYGISTNYTTTSIGATGLTTYVPGISANGQTIIVPSLNTYYLSSNGGTSFASAVIISVITTAGFVLVGNYQGTPLYLVLSGSISSYSPICYGVASASTISFNALGSVFPLGSASAAANSTFNNIIVCGTNATGNYVYGAYNASPVSAPNPYLSLFTASNGSIFGFTTYLYSQTAMSSTFTPSGGIAVLTPYILNTSSVLYYSSNAHLSTGSYPSGVIFSALSTTTGIPSLPSTSYWNAVAISGTGQYILAGVYGGSVYLSSNGNAGLASITFSVVFPSAAIFPAVGYWTWASMSSSGQVMILGNASNIIYVSYTYGSTWTLFSSLGLRPILSLDASKLIILAPTTGILYTYTATNATLGYAGVAVGGNAGMLNQAATSVAVGYNAGKLFQGATALAIGVGAGLTAQGVGAIAIGGNAAITSQGASAIAIGQGAGIAQGAAAVAIGNQAGPVGQGAGAVTIGPSTWTSTATGYTGLTGTQNASAVSIGSTVGTLNQTTNAIQVGQNSGIANTLNSVTYTGATFNWVNTITPYTASYVITSTAMSGTGQYQAVVYYSASIATTNNGNSATPVWFYTSLPTSLRSVLISNNGSVMIVYGSDRILFFTNYGQLSTTVGLLPAVPSQPSGTTGTLGGWNGSQPSIVCASTATTTLGQMQYQLVVTNAVYIYFTTTGSTAAGLATFCRIDGTNNLPPNSNISNINPQHGAAMSANGQYAIIALNTSGNVSNLYWTSNITSCTPPTSCPTWTLLASSGNTNGLPYYSTSSLYWYIVAMSGNGNYILAAGSVASTITAAQVYLSSNAASGSTPTFVAVSGLPATLGWGAFTISFTGQYMYAYGANPGTNALQTYVSSNFGVNWTLISSSIPSYSILPGNCFASASQDGQFTLFDVYNNTNPIGNGSYLQQATTNQSSQTKNAIAVGTNAGMQDVVGWQTTVLTNLTYGTNAMSSNGQYQIVPGNGTVSGYSITSNGNTPSPTWQYYTTMPGAYSNTQAAMSASGQNIFLFTSVTSASYFHSYSTNYGASFATCTSPVGTYASPITYTSTLSQILALSYPTTNTNGLYIITNALSASPTYKEIINGNFGIPAYSTTFGTLQTTTPGWATSFTGQYTIGIIATQSGNGINGASNLYWSSTLLSTIAATTSGSFFTSITGGNSGLPSLTTNQSYWTTVAISGNGQYILACGNQTNLYLSVNGTTGSPTFTATSIPVMFFKGAVISATGQYMYVNGISSSSSSGTSFLYYSNNYGTSWISVNVPNQNSGFYTSISSDGNYILLANNSSATICNGSLGNNVAIGANAGTINQCGQSVAIGANAGQTNAPGFSIAIGNAAGAQTNIFNYAFGSFSNSTLTFGAAVSYNGQYITYVAYYNTGNLGCYINYSLNYGASFTLLTYGATISGLTVIMSYSGQYQMTFPIAVSMNSYYSKDYGQNWTAGPVIGSSGQFYSAAASSTLQYIFASVSYGILYYSGNTGVTFAATSITNSNTVCTNFNGQYVFVTGGTGALSWYSSNGNNGTAANIIFTQLTVASGLPIGSTITRYSSMSGTGQYILVGSNSGPVYLSTNGGTTSIPVFTNIASLPQAVTWGPNGISYTGQYMAIFNTASPYPMYVSYDYGTTWVFLANISNPGAVCISGDGTKLVTSTQLSTTSNYIFTLQQNTTLNTIAIGTQAATANQGLNSIAIGYQSGATFQNYAASFGSIAIGYQAGILSQGYNAIAIGYQAGSYSATTGQPAATFMISTASVRSSSYGQVNSGALMYSTNGELYYRSASKTFVIDHPTQSDAYLVHACLEGPEAGVYYRGEGVILKDVGVNITLPSYSDALATTYTVHVTGKVDKCDTTTKSYRASRVVGGTFTVYGSPGAFFWHVYGKRGDIVTEPLKENVTKQGDGPYSYLAAAAAL